MLVVGLALVHRKADRVESDGTPVVPPIAISRVSVRMISNLQRLLSSVIRYSVPASAWVMRLAATRMVSSRRLVSRSCGQRDADGVQFFQRCKQVVAGC